MTYQACGIFSEAELNFRNSKCSLRLPDNVGTAQFRIFKYHEAGFSTFPFEWKDIFRTIRIFMCVGWKNGRSHSFFLEFSFATFLCFKTKKSKKHSFVTILPLEQIMLITFFFPLNHSFHTNINLTAAKKKRLTFLFPVRHPSWLTIVIIHF
jgi:hypothetical protein